MYQTMKRINCLQVGHKKWPDLAKGLDTTPHQHTHVESIKHQKRQNKLRHLRGSLLLHWRRSWVLITHLSTGVGVAVGCRGSSLLLLGFPSLSLALALSLSISWVGW